MLTPYAPRLAIAPKIQNGSALYQLNPKNGEEFKFNGRRYKIVEKEVGKFSAVDQTSYSKLKVLAAIQKFFVETMDRFADCSLSSREARLSERLMSAKNKHFRVDVDKTLLYRGENLPVGKNPAEFDMVFLHHKKYGDTKVFVNKGMLEFLKQQKAAGATVSITSTGGWADTTFEDACNAFGAEMRKPADQRTSESAQNLSAYLEEKSLKIDDFCNKKSLNKKSNVTIGLFQKYRVLGNKDQDGKSNIMVDDQRHQRTYFTHSINPAQFGMG